MLKKVLFLASVLSMSSATTIAGTWVGEGDLGYNSSAGNSDSESLSLGLELGYKEGAWKHIADLSARSASTDNETNTENYSLGFGSEYTFNERMFGFGNFRYQDDRFSAYDFQSSLSAGIGYHLINNDLTQLTVQGGPGYRRSELRETGEEQNEAILFAKVDYSTKITDTTDFASYLSAEAGEDNTYLESELALRVLMTKQLALKLAYLAKHNTDVTADTEKTDRYTTVSLNYQF